MDFDIPGCARPGECTRTAGFQQLRISLHSGSQPRRLEGLGVPSLHRICDRRELVRSPARLFPPASEIFHLSSRLVLRHPGDSYELLGDPGQNRGHSDRRACHHCLLGCRWNAFRGVSPEKHRRKSDGKSCAARCGGQSFCFGCGLQRINHRFRPAHVVPHLWVDLVKRSISRQAHPLHCRYIDFVSRHRPSLVRARDYPEWVSFFPSNHARDSRGLEGSPFHGELVCRRGPILGAHAGRGCRRHARSRVAPSVVGSRHPRPRLLPGPASDFFGRPGSGARFSLSDKKLGRLSLGLPTGSLARWHSLLVCCFSGSPVRSVCDLDHRGNFGHLGNCVPHIRASSRCTHENNIGGPAGPAHLVPYLPRMEATLRAFTRC